VPATKIEIKLEIIDHDHVECCSASTVNRKKSIDREHDLPGFSRLRLPDHNRSSA